MAMTVAPATLSEVPVHGKGQGQGQGQGQISRLKEQRDVGVGFIPGMPLSSHSTNNEEQK